MDRCRCLPFPQHRIDHVLIAVRDVEVRAPLSREADAVQELCEFPEVCIEVVDTIACRRTLVKLLE
jgi:hypothetical protein